MVRPKGGSDFAEVENICQQITDGNYESWYHGWKNGAEKLLKRSQRYSSKISRGHAFLRASRYFQASEFFLSPLDKRKIDVYQLSVKYFYEGLNTLEIPYRLETFRMMISLYVLFISLIRQKHAKEHSLSVVVSMPC